MKRNFLKLGMLLTLIGAVMAFGGSALATEGGGKININTAGIEELTKLTNVGPNYAERIVEYREAHDGFDSVEEITKVKGIGPKTLADNIDRITVEQLEAE